MAKNSTKHEKIAGGVGATAGAGGGVVGTGALVTFLGGGASAPAIAHGLTVLGGSMLGGIGVCAAIPVATAAVIGGAAYGITKAVKNKKKK